MHVWPVKKLLLVLHALTLLSCLVLSCLRVLAIPIPGNADKRTAFSFVSCEMGLVLRIRWKLNSSILLLCFWIMPSIKAQRTIPHCTMAVLITQNGQKKVTRPILLPGDQEQVYRPSAGCTESYIYRGKNEATVGQ